MAESGFTLLDLMKRTTKDGNYLTAAMTIAKTTQLMADIPLFEANELTSHVFQRAISLPTMSTRRINEGSDYVKADTEQGREDIALYEGYTKIDEYLMGLKNGAQMRAEGDRMALQGMSESLETDFIYGDKTVSIDKVSGLITRRGDSLGAGQVALGRFQNIWDNAAINGGTATATADKTSVLVVQYGLGKVYGVYPAGHKYAGIRMRNLGEQTIYVNSKPMQALQTHFRFNYGLVVEDPRCLHRIVNVRSGGDNSTDKGLTLKTLVRVLNYLPQRGAGAVIYMSRLALSTFQTDPLLRANVNFSGTDPFGKPYMDFQGVPIKMLDQLLDTEANVTVN